MSNDIVFGVRIKGDSKELRGEMAATEKAVERVGKASKTQFKQAEISAKQLQAAMRGVPAQFTDIFTSLASGQAPMMVLLQQGGQLKDMFGGIGPAAKALGGYVAGLINPLTLAGAAAAGLAVAFAQGDAESARYRKTIALTGNAAGVTAGQLQAMARAAAEASGSTQGSAAQVVTQLAASGKLAAEVMPQVTAAIVRMSEAGGSAAEDLVKQFAAIAKDPVKGVEALNAAYNLLEPTILAQVASLRAQGREEEAIRLAQSEAARAVDERANEIEASLGTLEGAWKDVRDLAAAAWDAMLDIGRDGSLYQQIAAAEADIARLRKLGDDGTGFNDFELAKAEDLLRSLLANEKATRAQAEAQRERAEANEALAGTLKTLDGIETRALARTRTLKDALAEYRAELDKLRKVDPNSIRLDPKKIAAVEAGLRKQFETLKKGARSAQKPLDELAKSLDRWYDARVKGLAAVEDEIEAERATREAMGLTRAEIKELEASRADLAASAKDVEAANFAEAASFAGPVADAYRQAARDAERAAEKLRELAAEKRATAGAIRKEEADKAEERRADKAIKEQRRAAEASAEHWQRIYADAGRALTDAIFEGGRDGWDLLKKYIQSTAVRAYFEPALVRGIGGAMGAVGLGPGGGGYGGSSFSPSSVGQVAGLSGSAFGTGFSSTLGGQNVHPAIAYYNEAGYASTASGLQAGAGAAGALGVGYLGYQVGGTGGAVVGAGLGYAAGAGYMGATAAAAIPYVGWVIAAAAVLQQMGVFGGGTPHIGGAAFADVGGGPAALANDANTPNFNLRWGAYRSDRSDQIDASVAGLVDQSVASIVARAARYGGDASGLRLSARFASDDDDDSRGAYRLTRGGEVLFDKFGKFDEDPGQGFADFGLEAVRAEVAALQALDLPEHFARLFETVDPLASSLDVLGAALTAADEVARQTAIGEQIRAIAGQDAMEAARVAGLSAASAWFESGERISAAAQAGTLSIEQMAQLAAEHYQNQVSLLASLNAASADVAAQFESTFRSIEYQALGSDEARYDYLRDEADRYLDVISTLIDPAEITATAGRLNQTINQAFGLLDPSQQAQYAPEFMQYTRDADAFVQDRITQVSDQVIDTGKSQIEQVATATTEAIGRAVEVMVEQLRDAGEAIPSSIPISVNVRVQAPPQTPATAEVGYYDGPG